MIFRDELARKVMSGEKTVTRRPCSENPRSPWFLEDCGVRPGGMYAVQMGRGKPAIGRIRVTAVKRTTLAMLGTREARLEGFETVEMFKLAWIDIHGKLDLWAPVWRIEFELADDQR